jgi:hypothetical protein
LYIQCNVHHEFIPEGKAVVNKCTMISFAALGIQAEGNALKNGEPTADFSFATMLQHTGR